MITLCAWCRKTRNDKGHWEDVREEHSDAMFTHGICPECLRKLNLQLFDDMLGSRNEEE